MLVLGGQFAPLLSGGGLPPPPVWMLLGESMVACCFDIGRGAGSRGLPLDPGRWYFVVFSLPDSMGRRRCLSSWLSGDNSALLPFVT